MSETIGTEYIQIEPSMKGLGSKINAEFSGSGESAGKSFSGGFGKVIGGVGKVAAGAVAAGAAAVTGLVASAVSSFGDYEQLVGGVETLFGSAANMVIDNADRAFQTAGLSANDYMETVTSFSASLLQAVGNDTEQAAKTADMALIDMADNANKMGSSMESIQNAYQGFAKQNYTMLDNLKLGYGGTKSEMERLLADAQKLTGVKYDIDNLNDVYNAIHAIQENLGIAGTTAKEASTTIQGSFASMKAAWENTLTAISQGDGWDMGVYIENLLDTVKTFAGNVMPVIQQSLVGVSELISGLAPEIAAAIPDLISQVLPGLLEAGVKIIQTLAEGILQAIPQLMPTITQIIMSVVQMLIGLLPQLITVGTQVIAELINGISQALPTLIPQITMIIPQIVQTLIDNIPLLLTCAVQLIQGLAQGLIDALPVLIDALPGLVQSLVDAIVNNLPMLINACIQLVNGIVTALPTIITSLLTALPQIIDSVVQGLITATPQLVDGCIQMVTAIVAALPQIIAALVAAMPQIIVSLANAVAQAFPVFISEITRLVSSILSIVLQFGAQIYQQVTQSMSNVVQSVVSWLQQLPGKAAYFAGAMAAQFVNAIRALPSNLQKIWNEILTAVKNFGQKFVEEGPKMAKDFISKLISAFKDVVKKIADIGKQIVEGLKEGISKSWTGLTDWIKELAGKLVQGFKDNLKIKSPSKVFADEIGKMIPLGIAEGIEAGMDDLDNTVISMTAELTGTADSSMVARTYQPASSQNDAMNDAMYDLLATYLPLLLNKEVDVKFEGGLDRFFRAIQNEARKNYQLTGAAL